VEYLGQMWIDIHVYVKCLCIDFGVKHLEDFINKTTCHETLEGLEFDE